MISKLNNVALVEPILHILQETVEHFYKLRIQRFVKSLERLHNKQLRPHLAIPKFTKPFDYYCRVGIKGQMTF